MDAVSIARELRDLAAEARRDLPELEPEADYIRVWRVGEDWEPKGWGPKSEPAAKSLLVAMKVGGDLVLEGLAALPRKVRAMVPGDGDRVEAWIAVTKLLVPGVGRVLGEPDPFCTAAEIITCRPVAVVADLADALAEMIEAVPRSHNFRKHGNGEVMGTGTPGGSQKSKAGRRPKVAEDKTDARAAFWRALANGTPDIIDRLKEGDDDNLYELLTEYGEVPYPKDPTNAPGWMLPPPGKKPPKSIRFSDWGITKETFKKYLSRYDNAPYRAPRHHQKNCEPTAAPAAKKVRAVASESLDEIDELVSDLCAQPPESKKATVTRKKIEDRLAKRCGIDNAAEISLRSPEAIADEVARIRMAVDQA